MITSKRYIILDYVPQYIKLITELCILNFNISNDLENVKRLINSNPKTTFWCASDDFSKKYVQIAGSIGIKNIIPVPIKTETINNFLNSTVYENPSNTEKLNLAPLTDSKIMIVDDNELNIKLLKDILNDIGIKITTCQNPENCYKIACEEKFDLFLLDILMPQMSGFELAKMIKTTQKNALTPIIFISAISGQENIINGYNLGACSYIEKPFHPNIVKAQIYNILKIEEEKKKQEKSKENFIATLTHDLKSPINAEINALKILLNEKEKNNNTNTEMLAELLNSAKYMKLITDKILYHYKQKNSAIKLKKELCSLNQIFISCIEELKFLTIDKNISIRLDSDLCNDNINVDKIEIKRVINNLISNAIEYSHKNSSIDIKLKEESERYICQITDYGLGIDLKNYKCIFEEYISYSKEHKKTGFGLGLNICKKIINAHGGKIAITSMPNKGTTVEFWLPNKKP